MVAGHIDEFSPFLEILLWQCPESYIILPLKTNHWLRTIDILYFEDWPQICATLHQFVHLYAMCSSIAYSFLQIMQALPHIQLNF